MRFRRCSAAAAARTLARSARSSCCTLMRPWAARTQGCASKISQRSCSECRDAGRSCLHSTHVLACVCSLQHVLDTPVRHTDNVGAHLDACGLQLSCHVVAGLSAPSSQRHICAGCGQAARGLLAQPRVATCTTNAHSCPCCAMAVGRLSSCMADPLPT